jgi:hypothetical protein
MISLNQKSRLFDYLLRKGGIARHFDHDGIWDALEGMSEAQYNWLCYNAHTDEINRFLTEKGVKPNDNPCEDCMEESAIFNPKI